MASYKLTFKKSVAKDLRPIPKRDITRILKRIEASAEDPRPAGCEKLSGLERYRVRQGVYRIIYEIVDRALIITVVKIGHRRDIYTNR
ncbi:MAG: type II toxin-antitoxin system RelE family toxin [Gammaproteobacteria bacterium]